LYIAAPVLSSSDSVNGVLVIHLDPIQMLLELPSNEVFFTKVSDAKSTSLTIAAFSDAAADIWTSSMKVPTQKINLRVFITPTEEKISEVRSILPFWFLFSSLIIAILFAMVVYLKQGLHLEKRVE
jgi:hypothetical protein